MSWMLSLWVAAALLALGRGQNSSYEAVNRSRDFSAKPGSCPTADGLESKSEDCVWDTDCPGWQKCCQGLGRTFCMDPTGSKNSFDNRRHRLNATVTVETDYQQLMSKDGGLLNHTRLVQAMITGALQSDDVSVYYVSSWAVHPYRTATSLLVDFSVTLPLYNVTSRLHVLVKHIPEVSAVTVEDVDECAEPALHQCSPVADCYNTEGSYKCSCHQGYSDANPSNPGTHCTESPATYLSRADSTFTSNATQNPPADSAIGFFDYSGSDMTPLSDTSSVAFITSQQTRGDPRTSSGSSLPTTTCSPPIITSLQSANVTGNSFCVLWSGQIQTNQTYSVVLSEGTEVMHVWETTQTVMKMRGLQPGVLYKITVTPQACASHGPALYLVVRTDAQAVDATVRLTNIQFSADLLDTSSQVYRTTCESITEEIFQYLSAEMEAMVDAGQVRIQIRSFSPDRVVVKFSIICTSRQSQDIGVVSSALLLSLMNSSIYTVDTNSTGIDDFNECASGENDCSQWASCTNTWGTFTCACLDGYKDNNPERPGRACQEVATLETTPSLSAILPFPPALTSETRAASTTPGSNPPRVTADAILGVRAITSQATATSSTLPTTSAPVTTVTNLSTNTSSASGVALRNTPVSGAVSVQCRVAAITVAVERDFLLSNNIRDSALYLGLQECGVNGGNATHAELTVAWNECGTRLVHNDTYYTASVTLFNTIDSHLSPIGAMEAPRTRLEVPIMCTYKKSMLMSSDFGSMGYDMIKEIIVGLGSLQATMELLDGTSPLSHNYSLSRQEEVVMEISINTSSDLVKVIVNKCWATSTPNPADTDSYTFVENSCSLNAHTKVLTNGQSSKSRVSVQIFSVVNLDAVYLHCQAHACVQMGSDTCVTNCLQRADRASNTIGSATGSVGPLQRSEDQASEQGYDTVHVVGLSCLGVGLSLFFIVGFVCLFYCQRNRIGHYNFSVKAKQEPFTVLDVSA